MRPATTMSAACITVNVLSLPKSGLSTIAARVLSLAAEVDGTWRQSRHAVDSAAVEPGIKILGEGSL